MGPPTTVVGLGLRAKGAVLRTVTKRGLFVASLALTLLVAQVVADDHDTAVSTDHLALLTDGLDAGLNLHGSFLRRRR